MPDLSLFGLAVMAVAGLLALIVAAILVGDLLARFFVRATRRPPDQP